MAKTVLITGASSGFGKQAALLFHEKGWNVAATMRRPEASAEWTSPLNLFCPQLDVTDQASIKKAVAETIAHFGCIDGVVNNAGYGLFGALEAITAEQMARQFNTNVLGAVAVTKAVLPHFRAQRSGVIITVSSISGRMSFPLSTAYHGTKWAVEGLFEALQYELKPFNIRVKLVEPGGIRTDFMGRSMEWAEHNAYKQMGERFLRLKSSFTPRLPGPEKVAAKIYQAACDTSCRLRYPVHHQPLMLMRQVTTDALWRWLMYKTIRKSAEKDANR